MSLREKLQTIQNESNDDIVMMAPPPVRIGIASSEVKMRIHQKMLDRVDLAALDALPTERLKQEVATLVERLIAEEAMVMNEVERRTLVRDVQYEMLGLGPLELLLADASISDILVNGHRQVFVERGGRLEAVDVKFSDDKHLMRIIDKIVSRIGRRIDESSPMVDARLQDGSRVNAIIPPLALDGPILSIRRFSAVPLGMNDLVDRYKSLTAPMAELLEGLIRAKVNLLVSGGTGSGKTTLLNILSGYIPHAERVVTIEDAAELQLQQPHVVRLETRPPNIEGRGEVTQRALLVNALRMRPDRIIVGEVRGAEAVDMLQAMNTGHEGSMTTIHANSPRDALARVENMIGMAGFNLPQRAVRQQIASAITVIVQVSRLADGRRKMVSMQELTGMESETITLQEIFSYKQSGIDADGKVTGYFAASGVRPKFMERLRAFGVTVSDTLFDPTQRYL
ncbi:MAG: CpaF family protein [Rhodocyclaceae bacterium]|nr:CpaF family protein [Rhodocyclaceae bacterium]